jgi:hypothetical protein
MSKSTRFQKGQSGNPNGRPKQRRPNISAFDIILDKRLTVTQGDKERELTIEEALQLQTYQDALKGSRMAIRKVLKMIEKREAELARKNPPQPQPVKMVSEYDADNAYGALKLLGIIEADPRWGDEGDDTRLCVSTWATQAALSRPGRKKFSERQVQNIKLFTLDAGKLSWPRGRTA